MLLAITTAFSLHLLLLKHLQRSPPVLLDSSGIFYPINRSVYILFQQHLLASIVLVSQTAF